MTNSNDPATICADPDRTDDEVSIIEHEFVNSTVVTCTSGSVPISRSTLIVDGGDSDDDQFKVECWDSSSWVEQTGPYVTGNSFTCGKHPTSWLSSEGSAGATVGSEGDPHALWEFKHRHRLRTAAVRLRSAESYKCECKDPAAAGGGGGAGGGGAAVEVHLAHMLRTNGDGNCESTHICSSSSSVSSRAPATGCPTGTTPVVVTSYSECRSIMKGVQVKAKLLEMSALEPGTFVADFDSGVYYGHALCGGSNCPAELNVFNPWSCNGPDKCGNSRSLPGHCFVQTDGSATMYWVGEPDGQGPGPGGSVFLTDNSNPSVKNFLKNNFRSIITSAVVCSNGIWNSATNEFELEAPTPAPASPAPTPAPASPPCTENVLPCGPTDCLWLCGNPDTGAAGMVSCYTDSRCIDSCRNSCPEANNCQHLPFVAPNRLC